MKNIIVCSDGTGNSAVKGRGTNVFKLFEAVDLNGHRTNPELTPQVALYDDGVGTQEFVPVKVLTGATGWGLSRNVRQLYKEIVRIYDPGDGLFLFGFSRGAFTVRTLVGFIATCGILDLNKGELHDARTLERRVRQAYRVYRKRYRTALAKMVSRGDQGAEAREFKQDHAIDHDVRITFLGVWDTVDAVGLPFHLADVLNSTLYRFKLPDRRLSAIVDHAAHALALDDQRHSFHPLLWTEKGEPAGRIEQVWFAGAHSNVGGGYPKQGMSLVALDWMVQRAEIAGPGKDSGLRLLKSARVDYRERAHVDDKLYDPRAGLGIFYRWKPRLVDEMCDSCGVEPKIHMSVLERVAHGTEDYAPGNLPPDARVVITETADQDNQDKDGAARERAGALEKVLRESHLIGRTLYSERRLELLTGRIAYYTYLLTCTVVPIGAAWLSSGDAPGFWLRARATVRLLAGLVTPSLTELLELGKVIVSSPLLMGVLLGGLVLAYSLERFTHRRTTRAFSSFWHDTRPALRAGLKAARARAREQRRPRVA